MTGMEERPITTSLIEIKKDSKGSHYFFLQIDRLKENLLELFLDGKIKWDNQFLTSAYLQAKVHKKHMEGIRAISFQ